MFFYNLISMAIFLVSEDHSKIESLTYFKNSHNYLPLKEDTYKIKANTTLFKSILNYWDSIKIQTKAKQ